MTFRLDRHSPLLRIALVLALLIVGPIGMTTAGAAPQDTAAEDDSFTPLENRFFNLYQSLQNQYGLRDQDRPYVESLMAAMSDFADAHPKDPRPVAATVVMAGWLQDLETRDAWIRRLAPLVEDNTRLVQEYAMRLKQTSQYTDALEFLDEVGDEAVNASIDVVLLKAECLYCNNRFEDSIALLTSAKANMTDLAERDANRLDERIENYSTKVEQWSTEQALRAAEAAADDLPRAEIETTRGTIVIELFENEAPNTVANFITLAESDFYQDIVFHRVVADFMSQVGDPTRRQGLEDPTAVELPKRIPDEHTGETYRNHFAGSVAMANTGQPNSGGTQFYLNHRPTAWLDGKHTVFGRILDGLDIARTIRQGDDRIIDVRITRKRDHSYDVRYVEQTAAAEDDPAGSDAESFTNTDTSLGFDPSTSPGSDDG